MKLPTFLAPYAHEFRPCGPLLVAYLHITPSMAIAMMGENRNNRRLRRTRMLRYASDMKNGHWQINSQAIGFEGEDSNFRLSNGQHRLESCITSDSPFSSLVVVGLPTKSHMTEDIGAAKTLTDFNHMAGRQYASSVSSIVAITHAHLGGSTELGFAGQQLLTPMVQDDILARYPEILEAAKETHALNNHREVTYPTKAIGLVILVNYFTNHETRGLTTEWLKRITTGADCSVQCPALHLRNRFIENANAKAKLKPEEAGALIFKSWNLFIRRRAIRFLRWRKEGPNGVEPFPTLPPLPHRVAA